MDFALSEHQQDVQRRAWAFAASHVAPVKSALDRAGSIPPDIIAGAADVGLLELARTAKLVEIGAASQQERERLHAERQTSQRAYERDFSSRNSESEHQSRAAVEPAG